MLRFLRLLPFALLSVLLCQASLVQWSPSGCTLDNGLVQARFDSSGEMVALMSDLAPGRNLVQKGYLTGPYLRDRGAATGRVVRDEPGLAEIAYGFSASHVDFELHYVIQTGIRGLHCFLSLRHAPRAGGTEDALGFFKHVLMADPTLMDYLQSTDSEQGTPPPRSAIREFIGKEQDHTAVLDPARFDNVYCRNYYSKYDYMQYAHEHAVYGLYSHSLQLGLYVLNGGREWLPGGPTKHFQTVHDPAIINSILNDEHMLPGFWQDSVFPAAQEWRKLFGPFLIWVGQGGSSEQAWQAAKQAARAEQAAWPLTWMRNPDYPTTLPSVSGSFNALGCSAAGAWVLLSAPTGDWQDQCLGYLYWTRADEQGRFVFPAVRPGLYSVHAYGGSARNPRVENAFNEFISPPFKVDKQSVELPPQSLTWNSDRRGELLFQIGIPDRSTREFHLGNLRRQYHLWAQVPDELDYRIPPADMAPEALAAYEAEHWPYLQSAEGSRWRLHFPVSTASKPGAKARLTLSLVGTCKAPQLFISVNGHRIVDASNIAQFPQLAFKDDASVRRCAVNGGYHHEVVIDFDAAFLSQGDDNQVLLELHIPAKNKEAAGLMYDALRLERLDP